VSGVSQALSGVIKLSNEAILAAARAGSLECTSGSGEVVGGGSGGGGVGVAHQVEIAVGIERDAFADVVAAPAEEARVVEVGSGGVETEKECVAAAGDGELIGVARWKVGGVGGAADVGAA